MGQKKYLTLNADDLKVFKWYVDASLAVHPDFTIHTGAIPNMRQGSMQSVFNKLKLNMKSSTKSELVVVDDASV